MQNQAFVFVVNKSIIFTDKISTYFNNNYDLQWLDSDRQDRHCRLILSDGYLKVILPAACDHYVVVLGVVFEGEDPHGTACSLDVRGVLFLTVSLICFNQLKKKNKQTNTVHVIKIFLADLLSDQSEIIKGIINK